MEIQTLYSSFDSLQAVQGLIIMTNLALLGAESHRLCIRLIAFQGLLLGVLPFIVSTSPLDMHFIVVGALFLVIKAVVMPMLLRRTSSRLSSQSSRNPYVGYPFCVGLGIGGLVLSIWVGTQLGTVENPVFSLVFPIGLFTVIAGLLLIVTRREILTQVFGYFVLENGIYLMGVPIAQQDMVWIELSVLLDILVASFVMVIAIHHINRAFASVDVERMASLRD